MNIFTNIIQYQYFNTLIQSNTLFTTEIKYKIFTPKMLDGNFSKNMATIFIQHFFYNRPKTVQDKYMIMKKNMNNYFINEDVREEYLSQLCSIQHKYFTLCKFIRKWKMAHTPVQITCDLFMNELDPNHRKTFKLLQKGRIYYFSLFDLVNILNHSISHSSFLFLHPTRAKNPHNNVEFSKSDLYNIYFQIRDNYFVIPKLIDLFFRSNFDIYYLKKHFENEIFHHTLTTYVNDYDDDEFMDDFIEMLVVFKYENIICVDKDYPISLLKATMKKYVLLFLKTKYITDRQLQDNYMNELDIKLRMFVKHNPFFGRKMSIGVSSTSFNSTIFQLDTTSRNPSNKMYSTTYYDVNNIPDNESTSHFLASHAYYENKYNTYIYRGNIQNNFNINIPRTPPLHLGVEHTGTMRGEIQSPLHVFQDISNNNYTINESHDSDDESADKIIIVDSDDESQQSIREQESGMNEAQSVTNEDNNNSDDEDDYDVQEEDYDW